MTEQRSYAVYLHAGALEVLGDTIKPYLVETPAGSYLLCREIDISGAFCELELGGVDAEGKPREVELMLPNAMIRLVMSTTSAEFEFGFG